MDAGTTAAVSDGAKVASLTSADDGNNTILQDIPGGHDDMDETTRDSADGICAKVSFMTIHV